MDPVFVTLCITARFHANFLDKHVMVHLGLSLCCIKRQIYASEVEQQTSEDELGRSSVQRKYLEENQLCIHGRGEDLNTTA